MPFRLLKPAAPVLRPSLALSAAVLLSAYALPASAQAPAAPIEIRSAQGQLLPSTYAWRAPAAARLQFHVQGKYKKLPYQTQAQLDWLPDAQRYEASQEVQIPIVGIRRQASVGRIGPQGLQPEIFIDRGRKEKSATFDTQTQQIVFSDGRAAAPWANGTQDRVSVFFQLAGMVAAAPQRYPAGTQITIEAASTSRVVPWTFTVRGTETLKLPAGNIAALKLEHHSASHDADDTQSTLWLAPSLQYLPVRIRMQENEGRDELDLQLQSHTQP